MNLGMAMLLFFFQGLSGEPGFLVVTSTNTKIEHLSKLELRQIWLKKRDRIGKVRVTPIQLDTGHPVRTDFDRWLYRKGFPLEEYWLKQRLQAGEKPPHSVANEAFVLIYVERNPGFIGFVPVSYRRELKKFKVKVIPIQ